MNQLIILLAICNWWWSSPEQESAAYVVPVTMSYELFAELSDDEKPQLLDHRTTPCKISQEFQFYVTFDKDGGYVWNECRDQPKKKKRDK